MSEPLTLRLLPERFAVCRLTSSEPVPSWALVPAASLISFTRTEAELSLVSQQTMVPEGVQAERDWRAFMVVGPLDFGLVGILAGLTGVLARAHIPVFVLSTFDTDYLLVKEVRVKETVTAFSEAGYSVETIV